jgi:hypothetical protein
MVDGVETLEGRYVGGRVFAAHDEVAVAFRAGHFGVRKEGTGCRRVEYMEAREKENGLLYGKMSRRDNWNALS